MLVEGRWTGECEGTFEAMRKPEETALGPGELEPAAEPEPEPEPEPERGRGKSGRWYRVRSRCAATAECVVADLETVEIVHEYAIGTRLWVEEIRSADPEPKAQPDVANQEADKAEAGDNNLSAAKDPKPRGGGSGKLRARTAEGWVSLVANDGTVLLVACESKHDLEEIRDKEELGEWL